MNPEMMSNANSKYSEGSISMTLKEIEDAKNKGILKKKTQEIESANKRLDEYNENRNNDIINLEDPGVSAEDLVRKMREESGKNQKTWH